MSKPYRPSLESLDDRTLLAGGIWTIGLSLDDLFSNRQRSEHAAKGAEVSSSETVGSDRSPGADVWTLLTSLWQGNSTPANASSAPEVPENNGAGRDTDDPFDLGDIVSTLVPSNPAQHGMGPLASLIQTVQTVVDNVTQYIHNALENHPNWGNSTSSNGSSSPPESPAANTPATTPGVQWPFGSSAWPSWLPQFIQQNLPPAGSNGGSTAGDSGDGNGTTSPAPPPSGGNANPGGSANVVTDTDHSSGSDGSASAGSSGDATTDSDGVGSVPSDGTVATGNTHKPARIREHKIMIAPFVAKSEIAAAVGTASTPAQAVAERSRSEQREAATVVAASVSQDDRMEIAAENEEARTEIPVETSEPLIAASAIDAVSSEAVVIECTMWLADLVSAFTSSETWTAPEGDFFESFPLPAETGASNGFLAMPPLALLGTISFAGGAIYWQRFGRRKNALVGANAVDEFFMNLSMDP